MLLLRREVPTDKAKAFAYNIDWQCVEEHSILEKKLRPWVKKKVARAQHHVRRYAIGGKKVYQSRFLGRGSDEALFTEKKGFSVKRGEGFSE